MNTKPRKKHMTFWEALETHPPYYVRMLAKRGHNKALSDAEVAIASGIEINRIREIKFMLNWHDVTYREILAFTAACNFDPTDSRHRQHVKRYENICRIRNATPFQYLMVHPKYESEFLPLIRILKAQFRPQSSAA